MRIKPTDRLRAVPRSAKTADKEFNPRRYLVSFVTISATHSQQNAGGELTIPVQALVFAYLADINR